MKNKLINNDITDHYISIKTKKVGFFGLGISAHSCYKFLQTKGFSCLAWDDDEAQRSKSDNLNVVHYKQWPFESLDFIVVAPGISKVSLKRHFIFKQAKIKNILLLNDIELFQFFFPDYFYVGITGSVGKSSCVTLLAEAIRASGKTCALGGNIGIPMFDFALETPKDVYVVEVSSFQLSYFHKVRFNVAGFLNLSRNHDVYHGGYNSYLNAKMKIFDNQIAVDYALLNIQDKSVKKIKLERFKSRVIGISIYNKQTNYISIDPALGTIYNGDEFLYDLNICPNQTYILGASFAYQIASICGVSRDNFITALQSFKGLPHRQSVVAHRDNITFINDSKATTDQSVCAALLRFKNIYWLVGGVNKSKNFSIGSRYLDNVVHVFAFGQDRHDYVDKLSPIIPTSDFTNLKDAFYKAYDMAKGRENSVILLSPLGVSFDEFTNFEARGEFFEDLVYNLSKK